MFEHLLPIGSVVLLRRGVKKMMIIGIKQINRDEEGKEYDYIGVLYPEGFLGQDANYLFNHQDIENVVFTGYENAERSDFIAFITEVSSKLTVLPQTAAEAENVQ